MDRNVIKQAKKGQKILTEDSNKRDMTVGELNQLKKISERWYRDFDLKREDALLDCIITAFQFGVNVGHKID